MIYGEGGGKTKTDRRRVYFVDGVDFRGEKSYCLVIIIIIIIIITKLISKRHAITKEHNFALTTTPKTIRNG